jgi:TatA/E family protein of Tat protein translocase
MADSLILMVMALVVFGPRRLPQIGRQIGKLMYEFRKASNDFKFQMEEELRNAEEADRRKKEEERLARSWRLRRLIATGQACPEARWHRPTGLQPLTPRKPRKHLPDEAVYPSEIPAFAEAGAEEAYPAFSRLRPASRCRRRGPTA